MKAVANALRSAARPVLSALAGLLLAAIVMKLSGYNAVAACSALWSGSTGLQAGPAAAPRDIPLGAMHISGFVLAQSLARVTPLIFTGLAVAIGLRAGLFNIGADGQMTVGALAAALAGAAAPGLSPAAHVPLVLLAGLLAGAFWGAMAGLLKAWRGVHEVISTIMLNYVASNFCLYLVTHSLKDVASMAPQTRAIAPTAWLTPVVPGADLTAGLAVALISAVLIAVLLRATSMGFDIRAVGLGREAARANGIDVSRVTVLTMAISGGLAGLAGAVQVAGVIHRYVDGISGSYGFDGIAVALLGGLSGGGVVLAALFFGALANGAAFMQLQTDVPDSIAVIVQAVVILFTGVRPRMRKRVKAAPLVAEQGTDAAL